MFRKVIGEEIKRSIHIGYCHRVQAGGSLLVSSGQELLSQEPAQEKDFSSARGNALGHVGVSQRVSRNPVVRKLQCELREQSCP